MRAAAAVAALVPLVALAITAQEPPKDPKESVKWKHNDRARPRPKVIDPGTAGTLDQPGRPPSDAVILFDGTDLAEWHRSGKKPDAEDAKPNWKVANGYAEVKGGAIASRKKFGDAQIHVEWATPKEVKGNDQGRGNSGISIGGFGEVQVLDSFENDTYPDGQAGALYGRFPPLVNASRRPGEWQVYDIVAHLPKVDETGKVTRPGRITVLHNGIVVHHAAEFGNKFGEYTINIQDHSNPVRFRNIWVRRLGDYDAEGTPPPAKK